MQHHWINKYTARPLRWLSQNTVSYFYKGHHRFHYEQGGYSLLPDDTAKGRVVIVSRQHYREFVNHYPVTRLGELKQVLRTEYQQNPLVMHYIGPVQEQRRAVCTIVFTADFCNALEQSCLLIPETLLLWHANRQQYSADSSEAKRTLEVGYAGGYFLYCGAVVPLSQTVNPFCADFQSFVLNNGVPDTTSYYKVADTDYASLLITALQSSVTAIAKLALWHKPALSKVAIPVKKLAISLGIVALTYVCVVTAYYQFSFARQQDKLAALGSEVNSLLDIQQQLLSRADAAERLASLRADKRYSAHIWQVIIPLLQTDLALTLQNVSTEDNRIILRGQANQATAVLTALQQSEWVTDVRFDDSVRRQRDRDIFVISLMLRQQPLPIEKASEQSAAEATDAAE